MNIYLYLFSLLFMLWAAAGTIYYGEVAHFVKSPHKKVILIALSGPFVWACVFTSAAYSLLAKVLRPFHDWFIS
jgi:hypothetical protein